VKHVHNFATSWEQGIAAVHAVNASLFPGRSSFTAWARWVRESNERIEAFEREHHERQIAWCREMQQ
jgi:hypothetical protein